MIRFLFILLALLLVTPIYADVIYVDENATGFIHNGNSWGNAYKRLRQAIENSEPGDQIWVAAGSYVAYTENGIGQDESLFFEVVHNISIYGGFNGTETSLGQRNSTANVTTITADLSDADIDGSGVEDYSFSIALMRLEGNADVLLDGFQITKFGYNFESEWDNIFESLGFDGTAEISNCHFYDNVNYFSNFSNDLEINDCSFDSNDLSFDFQSVTESTFSNNTLVFQFNDIDACTFTDNPDLALKSSVDLTNSLLVNNTFLAVELRATFHNCTLIGNDGLIQPDQVSWNNIIHEHTGEIDFDNLVYSMFDIPVESGLGNFRDEALFINSGNGNYRLLACSPGINAGLNIVLPPSDLDGNPRVFDGDIDLGCYEKQLDFPDKIFVDQDASGANNGTSWGDAYNSLTDALDEACRYTEVWVAEGIYTPTDFTDRSATFTIKSGMKIYGGFNGTETLLDQRDYAANATELSGEIGAISNVDNSFHVLSAEGTNEYTILNGFRIVNGNANGTFGDASGGGLTAEFSDLSVENCWFENNAAETTGGAIHFNGSGNPRVERCWFKGNSCESFGGAVYAGKVAGIGGDVDISKTRFWENEANFGAACYNGTNTMNIENTLIRASLGDGNVSGIENALGSDLNIYNSTLVNNGDYGVYNLGDIIARNCIFWNHDTEDVSAAGTALSVRHSITEILDVGNIQADPVFEDPGSNNYELDNLSPAIDTGDNDFVFASYDLKLQDRIENVTVDMGAFEVQIDCSNPQDYISGALLIDESMENILIPGTTECSNDIGDMLSSCGVQAGNSIWYKWNELGNGIRQFELSNVQGVDGSFNPKMTLYKGPENNLTEVACVNDNGIGEGEIFLVSSLQYGAAYFLRIEGANNQYGTFDLTITRPEATEILGILVLSQTSCNAEGLYSQNLSIEYINPPNSGYLEVNGIDFIITGSPQIVLLENLPGDNSDVNVLAKFSEVPENIYLESDVFTAPCCTPENDLCENAATITIGDPFEVYNVRRNNCATNDGDAIGSCFNNLGRTVWFKFAAPVSGNIEITAEHLQSLTQDFNIKLALYEGVCGALTEITCMNDAPVNVDEVITAYDLNPAEEYFLRVEGSNLQSGYFSLDPRSLPDLNNCPGDFNADGYITSADLLSLLSEFGCSQDCLTDMNNDGLVTSADLLGFLSVFGTECEQ